MELRLSADRVVSAAGDLLGTVFLTAWQVRAMRRMVEREPVPEPAERIVQSSGDRYRLAAVARLPCRERAAVELCLLGQVLALEAAVLLGISHPTHLPQDCGHS